MDAINEKTVCYTGHRTIPESDFEELIDAMEQDFYEKIDGRPLVIIFGGYNAGSIIIYILVLLSTMWLIFILLTRQAIYVRNRDK